MTAFLYKVSAPRTEMLFHPSSFWHTPDRESSTTRAREGYVRDEVLFAGDFDEVNIHLFPRSTASLRDGPAAPGLPLTVERRQRYPPFEHRKERYHGNHRRTEPR
jgi:hypothetical protein